MHRDDRTARPPPLDEDLVQRWQALGPDVGALIEGIDGEAKQAPLISLNADLVLEMGSVFKVFLLAAFAKEVERGDASWDETIRVSTAARIPHSEVLGNLPDGYEIVAHDLLVAMMGRSDNTATQMVVDRLPDGALDEVLDLAGLTSTTIDPDLRSLYRQATADPLFEPRCCRSTVADIVRFYRFALSGPMLTDPDVGATFRDILGSEDRDQGFVWGRGIACLRKSGYVAPPPLLAVGFAGAMLGGRQPLVFSFALNCRIHEQEGAEPAAGFGPVVRDSLLWALSAEPGRG